MRLKDAIIQIRTTEQEKEVFKKLAAKARMSQSDYFRWLIARESATL